jgi:hypothetical protein
VSIRKLARRASKGFQAFGIPSLALFEVAHFSRGFMGWFYIPAGLPR